MQNFLFCGFNQWETGVYFGPLFVLFKTLLGAYSALATRKANRPMPNVCQIFNFSTCLFITWADGQYLVIELANKIYKRISTLNIFIQSHLLWGDFLHPRILQAEVLLMYSSTKKRDNSDIGFVRLPILDGFETKTSSQAPSYASPGPKLSPTHRLADGGEV